MACPVCGNNKALEEIVGDRSEITCPICGSFKISGTARSMLSARIEKDTSIRNKLSYAIRNKLSGGEAIFIDSTNLDALTSTSLPPMKQQIENLLLWCASQNESDLLGRFQLSSIDTAIARIGAAGKESIQQLIQHIVQEGYLKHIAIGTAALTPAGVEKIEEIKKGRENKLNTKMNAAEEEKGKTKSIKSNCNNCGGDRTQLIRGQYYKTENDKEYPISWSNEFFILECAGCGDFSIRKEYWFSEWDSIGSNPLTGEMEMQPGIKVTLWPPPTSRTRPDWLAEIEDEVLENIFTEVYDALDQGLALLATMGIRAALDRSMEINVGDVGGFKQKLDKLLSNDVIGKGEYGVLEIMIDAGHAASHRGHAPERKQLNTIIDTVENFIHREFVLKKKAQKVKEKTPRRTK